MILIIFSSWKWELVSRSMTCVHKQSIIIEKHWSRRYISSCVKLAARHDGPNVRNDDWLSRILAAWTRKMLPAVPCFLSRIHCPRRSRCSIVIHRSNKRKSSEWTIPIRCYNQVFNQFGIYSLKAKQLHVMLYYFQRFTFVHLYSPLHVVSHSQSSRTCCINAIIDQCKSYSR